MKTLWSELSKQKKIAVLILAAAFVALCAVFFFTTAHGVFAFTKCLFAALVAAPVGYFLIFGKGHWKQVFAAHKKAIIAFVVLEVVLLVGTLAFFFAVAGISDLYHKVQFTVAILMVLLMIPVFLSLEIRHHALHQVYWRTALVLGVMFLFLQPLGTVPDEETHWRYAYYESNKLMGIPLSENNTIPMRAEDAEIAMRALANDIHAYTLFWNELGTDLDRDEMVQTGAVPNFYLKSKYQYWPQALGITIGRLLHLGGPATFMLARFINMLFFIVLATLAMKILPFGKMALFLIAIMPMTLQQVSSLSPDVMIFTFAMLIVAFTVRFTCLEEPPSLRQYILYAVLFVLCFLLMPVKGYVYGAFTLFPLMTVLRYWKKDKKKALVFLGLLVVCLGLFAWNTVRPMLTQTGYFTTSVTTTYIGGERYTLGYLLKDPKEIFRVAYNTYVTFKAFYLESMIGDQLQWLNVGMNPLYIYFFVVLLALASFRHSGEDVMLRVSEKIYMHAIAWITVAAVLFAMLIAYSPIEAHRVMGIQGRYFTPCLLPMLLTLRSKGITIDERYDTGILLAALVCLLGAVQWVLMTR